MPRLERVRFNNADGGDGDEDIFVYTGGGQRLPRDVKRVRIAENVDIIAARTFEGCRELIEVEGHHGITKIEHRTFRYCRRLRRVSKMTGVVEIEECAFGVCPALSELEFDKLEIIGECALAFCNSLPCINMPSIRSVGKYAFQHCHALTDAVFGQDLEKIEEYAFYGCTTLRRIAIPSKDNLIIGNNAFNMCSLSRVDTLDVGIISHLHMESWRNEMKDEIDRINQTLPNTRAIEKTQAVQQWIAGVLRRMEQYKGEHQTLVKEAMTLLELVLWKANLRENKADDVAATQEGVRVTRGQRKRKRNDSCITSGASIVIKNVLPFLALK
jgi:hypothetical protein